MQRTPTQVPRIRREGFAGQHLVVVPAPVRKAALLHRLLSGLMVTDAGYFPTARGHRVERPQGASTHLIILCLHGTGWVCCHGKKVQMDPGDIIWLPADSPHSYGAAEDQPWTIVWTHFCGDEAPAWQKELGWAVKRPICKFHYGVELAGTLGLDKVYYRLESGYSIDHLLNASISLRAAFGEAISLMKESGAVRTAAERTAAVREEILAKPSRPYRLQELATAAGLSVPHFSLLFRRQTGYAPIDFLIRQRIRHSCRLLDTTQITVAAIAAEVGFDDPYYFSRCFHRIMGCSPRDYRKTPKG
jgi:AraC family transcriptional regulator, arabinose operon regulatory protein